MCWLNAQNIVLESLVQSGFLPIFGKTETGLLVFEDRKKLELD
jgi:hypothetical protein